MNELAPAPEAQLAAPLSFAVPVADLTEFSALPEKRRTEIRVLLPLLSRLAQLVAAEHSIESACKIVSASAKHLMRGLSPVSLRRKYEAYLAEGDWRALVANYRGPNAQPEEFVQELKRCCELQQRSMKEALRQIRERFAAGEPVPGYGTWIDWYRKEFPTAPLPKVFPRRYPLGWSLRNLLRYGPSKGSRLIVTRGLAAARRHLSPPVRRDPSQLRPLELIVIDDFELDVLCLFPGDAKHKPQVAPVAGLLATDVATRTAPAWGIGPRLEREEKNADGSVRLVKSGIRSTLDVPQLLHRLFSQHGLPPYPVTILCENATASISPDLEAAIGVMFDGRVKIERTGLINHRTLSNGFIERGGKPWEKGWVEALFAGVWNILGAQEGYKGSIQRLNGPGDLDEKIRITKLLIGQGEGKLNLPPEKIALLRTPFRSIEELERVFAWALALRDARDDHAFIGFERRTEFLLEEGGEPQPFENLALVPVHLQPTLKYIDRAERPIERWQRLTTGVEFQHVPAAVLALLMLTPKRVEYRSNCVTFIHDKSGYSYIDPEGTVTREMPEGTKLLAFFDPKSPAQLHLADLRGAFVGTLVRMGGKHGMIDLRDKDALAVAAGLQQRLINRAIADVRARHAAADEQLAADRLHNAAVVAQHKAETAGLTTAQKIGLAAGEHAQLVHEQKMTAAKLRRADSATDALLGEAATPAPSAPPASPATKSFDSDDLL
jgi:hypothetical protein